MKEENRSKADVQNQFGKNAANYVSSNIHAKGRDLERLKQILEWNGTESVLDIATGGGHVANALAPLARKVTAFDLTSEMLVASEKFVKGNGHANVDFIQGDAEELPFGDDSFDVAVCRIAAHHFSNVSTFVQEAYRIVKKGGVFLLIDNTAPENDRMDKFYNEMEKRRDYSHQRALKKSEWLCLIEEKGFELEELYRFPKQFFFEKWCETMDVPEDEKHALSEVMLQAPQDIKQKFRIEEKNGTVYSFEAEAILLKALKKES
ncbi:class I SAM-dependent methyltransferase [Virgibacillus senegalensis]|uniref:class I SAM-dependent methyltransferase n=1 Tax=Virgibacillus senegalensis TaxID=1499679 RepID=UPI00069E5B99|nr:class I SAM-dependent methyltransferase [Virgibacillus senegalensis]